MPPASSPSLSVWCIYYGDGSTFDYTQGEPEDAPPLDVQVIAAYDRHGSRYLLHGGNTTDKIRRDWFMYNREDGWYALDLPGVLDQLLHFPRRWTALKMGRSVPDEVFKHAVRRADAEWPRKR